MHKPTYYLIGGGEFDDPIERRVEFTALKKLSEPAHLLIFPWTTDDPIKSAKYRPRLTTLFKQCGASSIVYAEDDDSPETIDRLISATNVLYLPGGSPEVLMRKLSEHNLFPKISTFPGLVLGISAGAYVLTKEYIDIDPDQPAVMIASGLININIKCHYTTAMDNKLRKLSATRDVYAIPDNAALVYHEGQLSILGNITRYHNGSKSSLRKN